MFEANTFLDYGLSRDHARAGQVLNNGVHEELNNPERSG
jgi:hypothetical protein